LAIEGGTLTDDSRGEEPQQTIPEMPAAAPQQAAPSKAPAAEAPQHAAPSEAPAAEAPQQAAPSEAPVVAEAPVVPEAPAAPEAPVVPAAMPAPTVPADAPAPAAPVYAPAAPVYDPAVTQAPAAPPRKGLSTGAILGIVGGGLVLLIALIVGGVFAVGAAVGSAAGGGGGNVEEVAEAYLTAIADADAETALSYLDETATPGPLLTDEALAVSQKLAPITDIVIGEPDITNDWGTVPVTYSLGDTAVSAELSVYRHSDDWKVSIGTGELSLYQFEGLEPTINGIAIEGEYADAFPGAYEYGVAVDGFAVEGETIVLVTAPGEYPDASGMEVALTPEAAETFRQAVAAAVDGCVAATTLEAGCGLAVPGTLSDGTQLTDGTLTRSLSAETRAEIAALEPELDYSVPTLVSGGYLGSVDVTAQCTKDGQSGTCSVLFAPSLGTPSMNFGVKDPVIEWD